MAFESLQDKFSAIFKKMRGQDRLTESNMDDALREIRVALLESDVNFKVVKNFTNDVKEKALGEEVIRKVNPSQQLIKICHDELVELLGADETEINYNKNGLTIIMLVGLQGSGKTTSAGKLAYTMKNKLGKKPMLAALDVYRPAAIEQLETLSKQVDVPFFTMGKDDPVKIAKAAREKAIEEGCDVLILDTAGRLAIDEELMRELQNITDAVHPDESLLLVDAMAGQDAVNVANVFHSQLSLTGVIMSKLDGDAKGGAALSIKYMTGLPIKFAGVGEKITDLDVFHPDRMADRILGMGDVVTLVEKAQEVMDEKEAAKSAKKMMEGNYTLEDMIKQLKSFQKIGSLGMIAKLIPGMPKLSEEQQDKAKKEMVTFEAIYNSMTPYERKHPETLRFSQKNRISKGSGKTNADINRMIKKFEQSKEMMKQMGRYAKSGKIPPGMGGLGGYGQ